MPRSLGQGPLRRLHRIARRRGTTLRQRVRGVVCGPHAPQPVVAGPRLRFELVIGDEVGMGVIVGPRRHDGSSASPAPPPMPASPCGTAGLTPGGRAGRCYVMTPTL